MNDRILSLDGLRALADPMVNGQLGIDPLVTDLVLGFPSDLGYPGERILPRKQAPKYNFSYQINDKSHMVRHDTLRAMRAPIRLGDFQTTTATAKLDRFSFGTMRDVDEIANAASELRLREKSARFGRRIVNLDIESRRAALLTNTANYDASNVVTISSGFEWNTSSGDSRTDVRTILRNLQATTGMAWDRWTVWLEGTSYSAALEDPIFLATRSNFTADTSDAAALARYWGVKSVWTSTPMLAATASSAASQMYGDKAIIYFDGEGMDLDAEFGDFVFGHTFTWNGGVASTPFYNEERTSWIFPWTDYAKPLILQNLVGGLIVNCAA